MTTIRDILNDFAEEVFDLALEHETKTITWDVDKENAIDEYVEQIKQIIG